MTPQKNFKKISALRKAIWPIISCYYPFFKECSIIHVIKALNMRIFLYIASDQFTYRDKLGVSYISKAVACMTGLFSWVFV